MGFRPVKGEHLAAASAFASLAVDYSGLVDIARVNKNVIWVCMNPVHVVARVCPQSNISWLGDRLNWNHETIFVDCDFLMLGGAF